MKRFKWLIVAVALLGASAYAAKVDSTMLVFLEDVAQSIVWSGDKLSVASGGEIEVRSGATLDLQSGATITQAGTITQTGAVNQSSKLDILDGGEVEISSGATFEFVSGATWTVADGSIPRADLTEDALAKFDVPLSWLTIGTGSNYLDGTAYEAGTDSPVGKTAEVDNTTTTETATFNYRLPENYVATGDVKFSVSAKYVITGDAVAGANMDVDVLAYEVSQTAGTVGADICATSAIATTNAYAIKLFTITAADLVAGDLIKVSVVVRTHDSHAGAGTIATYLLAPHFQIDVKG